MISFNNIIKLIHSFFSSLKLFFCKITDNDSELCRIEEIDLLQKMVVIYCRGVAAPVKLTFDEIINDLVIISNLPPRQASWIGYYYGKYYSEMISGNNRRNAPPHFCFAINNSLARFNLTMLSRNGDLVYLDKDSHTTSTLPPVRAMINEKVITMFDPIQACYIGILAGTENIKIANQKSPAGVNSAHLRLV